MSLNLSDVEFNLSTSQPESEKTVPIPPAFSPNPNAGSSVQDSLTGLFNVSMKSDGQDSIGGLSKMAPPRKFQQSYSQERQSEEKSNTNNNTNNSRVGKSRVGKKSISKRGRGREEQEEDDEQEEEEQQHEDEDEEEEEGKKSNKTAKKIGKKKKNNSGANNNNNNAAANNNNNNVGDENVFRSTLASLELIGSYAASRLQEAATMAARTLPPPPPTFVPGALRLVRPDIALVTPEMLGVTPSQITLFHLMQVQLLFPGDMLECLGTRARVTEDGAIILPDGVTIFDKPSPFATYANKLANRSLRTRLNGWAKASAPVVCVNVGFPVNAPAVQKYGVSLHDLRETFKRMLKDSVNAEGEYEVRFVAPSTTPVPATTTTTTATTGKTSGQAPTREAVDEKRFGAVVSAILESSPPTWGPGAAGGGGGEGDSSDKPKKKRRTTGI